MRRIVKVIDAVSEYTGRAARWLCVLIVIVLTYEVVMRYAFTAPTEWAHLATMMLYGSIGLFGLAYTHLHRGHVRVDVIYERLSHRGKALVDAIFALLVDLPLVGVLISAAVYWAWRSWTAHEVMYESFWYPPAWPFRIVMVIGLSLFFLQIVAEFIRSLLTLRRGVPHD